MRRNSLLKHVIERKKERKRRIEQRGRRKRRKHIMDDLKETRGYWK
jgi:hypothetical protein